MEAQPKTFGNKAAQQRDAGTLLRSPDLEPQGFTSVPNWLKDVRGLSHHSKLAFVYLIQYSWQDGQCFPGLDTLAADLEVERHTAARYLKELEVAGLISIERRGQGLTNVYHLRAWRPGDSLDGTIPCHQGTQDGTFLCHQGAQDGTFLCHQGDQDGTEMYHLDGTEMRHQDGTKLCHNKDTVTKTQVTTIGGLDVISNNGETSARRADSSNKQHARAREEPPQDYLTTQDITPDTSWLMPLARRIHKRWGGGATNEDLQTWCDPLSAHLTGCTPSECDTFVQYLFSNDVMKRTSSPRGVRTVLGQDAQRWLSQGKPPSKIASITPAPKVPAHVQWEHDHAHNPKSGKVDANSPPEVIARIAAHLRRTGGEEKAQAWLRSIGLTEQGA